MNDPPRLLDQTNDPLTLQMLSAARQQQPRRRSLNSTLLAVGAAASVVGGHATAGAAASSVAAASLVKLAATWTLLGVVVVGGGVAGAEASGLLAPPAPGPRAPVNATGEGPKARPQPRLAPPELLSVPHSEPVLEQNPTHVSSPASSAASRRALAPGHQEHLDQEVALLDRAWGALGRGQFDETRGISERYLVAYPHGRLEQEARYLKMQAARRLGHGAEAQAEAARLLELNPSGPHAKAAHEVQREVVE